MLVLSRKNREAVVVSDTHGREQLLKVTVLEIRGGKVKLGIEGERTVPVYRGEVWDNKFPRSQPCHSESGQRPVRRSSKSRVIKAVFRHVTRRQSLIK
jgi:carbon storage regulator